MAGCIRGNHTCSFYLPFCRRSPYCVSLRRLNTDFKHSTDGAATPGRPRHSPELSFKKGGGERDRRAGGDDYQDRIAPERDTWTKPNMTPLRGWTPAPLRFGVTCIRTPAAGAKQRAADARKSAASGQRLFGACLDGRPGYDLVPRG